MKVKLQVVKIIDRKEKSAPKKRPLQVKDLGIIKWNWERASSGVSKTTRKWLASLILTACRLVMKQHRQAKTQKIQKRWQLKHRN